MNKTAFLAQILWHICYLTDTEAPARSGVPPRPGFTQIFYFFCVQVLTAVAFHITFAPRKRIGRWCNGNTEHFGCFIQGSSPCRPTKLKIKTASVHAEGGFFMPKFSGHPAMQPAQNGTNEWKLGRELHLNEK